MTDEQPIQPTSPSESLPPEVLDQALLVVAIRADGTGITYVHSSVSAEQCADWLIEHAEQVRNSAAVCPDCMNKVQHQHVPTE